MGRSDVAELDMVVVCGNCDEKERWKDYIREQEEHRKLNRPDSDRQDSSSKKAKELGYSVSSPSKTLISGVRISVGQGNKKPPLQSSMPKDLIEVLQETNILFESNSKGLLGYKKQSKEAKEIINKVLLGEYTSFLSDFNRRLIDTSKETQLNIRNISIEKYLLEQAKPKGQIQGEIQEIYDATGLVLGFYEQIYEKKIDAILARNYQTLSQNFKYSTYRIQQAQRRHQAFMNGKKFKISKQDQDILDKLVRLNQTNHIAQNAKQLNTISKVFGGVGHLLTIRDFAIAFNEAQKTKNWDNFFVKVSALGAGMLIGSLVGFGISISTLPMALVIGTLGVIASHYFTDDNLWKEIQHNIKSYLE